MVRHPQRSAPASGGTHQKLNGRCSGRKLTGSAGKLTQGADNLPPAAAIRREAWPGRHRVGRSRFVLEESSKRPEPLRVSCQFPASQTGRAAAANSTRTCPR